MKSKEDMAREILTERLLSDFKSEITGKNQNRVVGVNPEEAFFVGKLMSINDEEGKNKAFSSKTFIESISVDFYILDANVPESIITVSPRGEFFYRVYPSLEEQRNAIIKSVYETTNEKYNSFDDLKKDYEENPEKFVNTEIKLVPVYKKLSITDKNYTIKIKLQDILSDDESYGYIDERHEVNKALTEFMEQLMIDLQQEEDFYRFVVNEKTKVCDLYSPEQFSQFINGFTKKDVKINQNWDIFLELTAKKIKNKYLISVSLINNSQIFSNTSMRKGNDKKSIETLFNSGLLIHMESAQFEDIEMDYFEDDYKYDRTQKAIGTNCTVTYDKENNSVVTEHMPVFIQHRFITNDKLAVKFDNLVDEPQKELQKIRRLMDAEIDSWKLYKQSIWKKLTDKGKQSIESEIKEFNLEIQRFQKGIDTIVNYPIVQKSFIYMNETFKNTNKKYTTWRLFQLVFIVSILPDIVASDENLMPEDEKKKTTLDAMALLYFPTGGGKTEAFLGVLVFNLFF